MKHSKKRTIQTNKSLKANKFTNTHCNKRYYLHILLAFLTLFIQTHSYTTKPSAKYFFTTLTSVIQTIYEALKKLKTEKVKRYFLQQDIFSWYSSCCSYFCSCIYVTCNAFCKNVSSALANVGVTCNTHSVRVLDIIIVLRYIIRKCLDITVCKFEIASSGRCKCFSAFKNKVRAAEMAHLRSVKGCRRLDCCPKWRTTRHSRNCKYW